MSGYIGRAPLSEAIQSRAKYTVPAAGQTSFSFSYQPGFIDVFLNGIKLEDTVDYTATNGSDIILTLAATSGQIFEAVGLTTFSLIQGKQNYNATTAPTVTDDSADGYRKGSMWIDTVTDDIYRCTDDTVGAAVWIGTTLEVTDLGALATKSTIGTTDIDNGAVTATKLAAGAAVPTQTGQTGKFLKTDGTNATWATVDQTIAGTTGLQAALDAKVDDTQVLTNVPSGAVFTDTETTTTLSIAANVLKYTDEVGAVTNLDLSLYLDDTNAAYIASGALNGSTGIATFTRSDASTFTVDLSALLDDTKVTVNNTLTSTSTTEALSAAQGKVLQDNKVDNTQVLTNVPSGAVFTDTDTIYSHPATHPASMLTGALPAIDGSALTGIDAVTNTADITSLAVGGAGSLAYDTSTDILSVSDGSAWNPVYEPPPTATVNSTFYANFGAGTDITITNYGFYTFSVSSNCTVKVKLWGAGGGGATGSNYLTRGGAGGYTQGNIALQSGVNYVFLVGRGGVFNSTYTNAFPDGGATYPGYTSGSGGGSTRFGAVGITNNSTSYNASTAVYHLIAGGGAGGTDYGQSGTYGGWGGGTNGQSGGKYYPNGESLTTCGGGGTQSSGGSGGGSGREGAGNAGSKYAGGNGHGSGGGGGYYGGGAAGGYYAQGGGGSGYISSSVVGGSFATANSSNYYTAPASPPGGAGLGNASSSGADGAIVISFVS